MAFAGFAGQTNRSLPALSGFGKNAVNDKADNNKITTICQNRQLKWWWPAAAIVFMLLCLMVAPVDTEVTERLN